MKEERRVEDESPVKKINARTLREHMISRRGDRMLDRLVDMHNDMCNTMQSRIVNVA